VERPYWAKLAVENEMLETEIGKIEKILAENQIHDGRLWI